MSEEKKILNDKELKKVTGGFTGDINNVSNFKPPTVVLCSENGHDIFWGSSVRRISDGKCFRCTGYENNSDGTTSWTFINDFGSFEQFIFVATKQENGNILYGFVF